MAIYVKAVNVADIQAKIAKKEEEIRKKEAWIQKVNERINKKMTKLSAILAPEDLARVQKKIDLLSTNNRYSSKFQLPEECSTDFLTKKYNWDWGNENREIVYSLADDASSIYTSNEAIKEAKGIIAKYEDKLAKEAAKASEIDEIPECLKEFMTQIIDRWDRYDMKLRDESEPYYRQLVKDADDILYKDNPYRIYSQVKERLAELYPDIEEGRYYRDLRRERFDDDHINRPFSRRFGVSKQYASSFWGLSDEQIHKANYEAGRNLILDLLKRVTKITGPVRDWSGLRVTSGNNGGAVLNGIVIGDDGKARVESIYASGPIQRLHIRTLVKEVH